jgi:SpoVK/Ycf46/Vps4 family AAA+-type ATPase
MSKIVVTFEKDWLDRMRKDGVRVIRLLEKWIAGEEGISLKSSSSDNLTVEMNPPMREGFISALAARMKEFGESDPWSHAKFSGDIAGLDLPQGGEDGGEKPKGAKARPKEMEPAEKGDNTEVKETPPPGNASPDGKDGNEGAKEPPPDPAVTLNEICSKVPVKHSAELAAYLRETAAVIPTLQRMGLESTLWHQHLLLAVDAGYGRTEFLMSLLKLYKAFGLMKVDAGEKAVREYILLAKGKEQEADGYRVPWDTVLEAAENMNRANRKHNTAGTVLYVDVSAWQGVLDSPYVKTKLRRLNALCGTFLLVFRVPFVDGAVLRGVSDALNDILNVRTVHVPPAKLDDMVDYARETLAANSFRLEDDAVGAFEQWILREKVDDCFFGYKTVDKMVQKMIYEKALSNCRKGAEDRTVGVEDLKPFTICEDVESGNGIRLDKMIGMDSVARRIKEVIVQIQTQKELASAGKNVAAPAIHMLFTGNPGTGKTTVARILAGMMKQAGILRKGHLVEVRGRDLCGQYIGETAPKTSAICRDAYGSVLFIDEAYSLFRDEDASSRDYGREALDTLVAEMENHRDDFCVVMAGYKDEMDAMLRGNAGLKSRIPYEIEFPNYSREDLEKIFFTMLDGNFDYEDGLEEAVHEFFSTVPDETINSKDFSNARFVRNLYERTWGKAAYRRSLDAGSTLKILKSDLAGAASDSEFVKLLKKGPERNIIGFGA